VLGVGGLGDDFVLRLLTATDRERYQAGVVYATNQPVTMEQATRAVWQGLDEAGLATPEHSPEAFDCGWEFTMTNRVCEMVETAAASGGGK